MKRIFISALPIILILAVVCFTSWIIVRGSEMDCIQAISEDYSCSVDKTEGNLSKPTTHSLSEAQMLQLKELFLESRFIRRFSHSYRYKGLHDIYSLLLECRDSQGKQVDFIQIFIVEDLYISISAPYSQERFTLKILNSQFCDELESILLGTEP